MAAHLSGPARRTDHRRTVAVVVGTADPQHRIISRFVGGQHIDNTGHRGDIVVRARWMVNAVVATSCGTTLEANDLRKKSRVLANRPFAN